MSQEKFNFKKYLGEWDHKKSGKCLKCSASVQWKLERLEVHKRLHCETDEEFNVDYKRYKFSQDAITQMQLTQQSQQASTSTNKEITDEEVHEINLKATDLFVIRGEFGKKVLVFNFLMSTSFNLGIPFRVADSPEYRAFMESMNPAYAKRAAKSRAISGRLLDERFDGRMKEIMLVLQGCIDLTLIDDGMTNQHSDHLNNYFIKAPSQLKSIYFRTIDTLGVSQDAATVARQSSEIIDEVGSENFSSCVTDTCNTMVASWRILKQKYPRLNCYGCSAHVLNLLIGDIAKSPGFDKLCSDNDEIVKFINHHHATNKVFRDYMKSMGVTKKLCLRVKTRWFGQHASLQNTYDAKDLLKRVVIEQKTIFDNVDSTKKSAVLKLINSREFWTRLENCLSKIDAPARLIGRVEAEGATIEIVQTTFIELFEVYTQQKDQRAQKLVKDRWNYVACDPIRAAHLLNHKAAMESSYFPDEEFKCLAALKKMATQFKGAAFAEQITAEIQNFHHSMQTLTQEHKESLLSITSAGYWNMFGKSKYSGLSQLAHYLFGSASSASSERGWSTLKFVHTRLRNRLSNEKINKILFLMMNKLATVEDFEIYLDGMDADTTQMIDDYLDE